MITGKKERMNELGEVRIVVVIIDRAEAGAIVVVKRFLKMFNSGFVEAFLLQVTHDELSLSLSHCVLCSH